MAPMIGRYTSTIEVRTWKLGKDLDMYVCFDQAASHMSEMMLVITEFNSFNGLMIVL
jgi:hypothetical protein